jgi:hypothetical protein
MRIAIAGASGLVGTALSAHFNRRGDTVVPLVRDQNESSIVTAATWNPDEGRLNPQILEGCDVIVNLTGENITAHRWNAAFKERLLSSRLKSSSLLCKAAAQLPTPPRLLLNASAIGFYGERADTLLDEKSSSGHGFFANLCQQWEAATSAAVQAGIRTALLRFGVILTPSGGALSRMLQPFRLGLGGTIGTGQQFMSWITIDDVIAIIDYIIINDSLQGPLNIVSPQPVTNADFTHTLGAVLNRPTICHVPALLAKLLLGEMASEAILASTRVSPQKLIASGYTFLYPELEGALRHLLKAPAAIDKNR